MSRRLGIKRRQSAPVMLLARDIRIRCPISFLGAMVVMRGFIRICSFWFSVVWWVMSAQRPALSQPAEGGDFDGSNEP
jgi:hypothetical protein